MHTVYAFLPIIEKTFILHSLFQTQRSVTLLVVNKLHVPFIAYCVGYTNKTCVMYPMDFAA
jgi:hypothetical protein